MIDSCSPHEQDHWNRSKGSLNQIATEKTRHFVEHGMNSVQEVSKGDNILILVDHIYWLIID